MTPPELIRHGILSALYPTRALRVASSRVTRLLNADGLEVTDADVVTELEFLASLNPPLVEAKFDDLGSTRHWKITPAGTLRQERGA